MEMIAIGKIRTSHGIKGFVKIASYSGETEHFYQLTKILLKKDKLEKQLAIDEIKPLGDSVIIKFDGYVTPEKAKTLAGWEIWVSRDKAASLSEGEFYHADLCLCEMQFEGEVVGRIISMLEGGGGDLFEVELISGSTVLIPFRDEFIGKISIKDKLIELKNKWILG
jgi:16S rRNA processing protein RimM